MTRHPTVLLVFCLAVLAASQTQAVSCPGNGAKLTIVVNNPTTTTGQKVFLSGQAAAGASVLPEGTRTRIGAT